MSPAIHQPVSLDEALALLDRSEPPTRPLGGGSHLGQSPETNVELVDLGKLGFDTITARGNQLDIGATASLQSLADSEQIHDALRQAILLEADEAQRNQATVAGTLVASDGPSPFATLMLALEAQLSIEPGGDTLGLGDLLPLRDELLQHKLITQVRFPSNVSLCWVQETAAPESQPILIVALARWPSGRARLALGGWGATPVIAMDGGEADGALAAVENACSRASDELATAELRIQVARQLTGQCLENIQQG